MIKHVVACDTDMLILSLSRSMSLSEAADLLKHLINFQVYDFTTVLESDPWNGSKLVWAYRYHTRLYVWPQFWHSISIFFGAVKRDWLLILALQTCSSLGASYMLITIYSCNDDYIIIKNTRKSYTYFLIGKNFRSMDKKLQKSILSEFSMTKVL
jgi:hypothetical protein